MENPHRIGRGGGTRKKGKIDVSYRTVFLWFLCRNFEYVPSYSPEHTERKLNVYHTRQLLWLCQPQWSPENYWDEWISSSGCLKSFSVRLKAMNLSVKVCMRIHYCPRLALLPTRLCRYTRNIHHIAALPAGRIHIHPCLGWWAPGREITFFCKKANPSAFQKQLVRSSLH